MKKILLVAFLLIELNLLAQDPVFSQFYSNQLYVNPAFAGIKGNPRVGINYRNQWTAIPSKFNIYNFWGDYSISPRGRSNSKPRFSSSKEKSLPVGIGIIALQDVSGEGFLTTTSFGVIQSLEFCIIKKKLKLRFGTNPTVTNKRIDWNKLVFSDQLDGTQGQIYTPSVVPGRSDGKTFFDLAVGGIISWSIPAGEYTITNIFGYAVSHLTQPNEGLSGVEDRYLPRKHTIHGTLDIEKKGKISQFSLSPNFIYEQQANFTTLNMGFYMGRKPLIVGVFYRERKFLDFKDSDSAIIFVGLQTNIAHTNNVLKIGYSYDMTINNLGTNTRGSHEISISLEFNQKGKGPVDCWDHQIDPSCKCPVPFFY